MKNNNAKHWIEKLQLEPHPQGGYFRQTYRSDVMIAREALPAGFSGARLASTAISARCREFLCLSSAAIG